MPAVARQGDLVNTGHGCDSTTTLTSPRGAEFSVYANSIGVECVGNPTVSHLIPGGDSCVSHVAYINEGSPTVYIAGIAIGRVGDSADAGAILTGSPNVFAG